MAYLLSFHANYGRILRNLQLSDGGLIGSVRMAGRRLFVHFGIRARDLEGPIHNGVVEIAEPRDRL
jgi:hypothetical protein